MLPKLLALGTIATLLMVAAPVQASSNYSGSFLAGDPVAYLFIDACGEPGLEGVNSNCVALSGTDAGQPYSLEVSDASGAILAAGACFYSESSFLGCDTPLVPADATRMSVSALGGVNVEWTATVG